MATQKEIIKEKELQLLKKLNELENFILTQSSQNQCQCKAEDLFLFVAELREICKAQGEVLRLSFVIACEIFRNNYSGYFKALRSNLYKIYNKP